MSQTHFLVGFLLILISIQGYYSQRAHRNEDGKVTWTFSVQEVHEPSPELLERFNRRRENERNEHYRTTVGGFQSSQNIERVERPAARNREKGPRRRPQERQGPQRQTQNQQSIGSPAVRNREKGPRRRIQEQQQGTREAVRNREKGPRRRTQEYQRQGTREAIRNREKGPRRRTQQYQRQDPREAVRNREKGPRRRTQQNEQRDPGRPGSRKYRTQDNNRVQQHVEELGLKRITAEDIRRSRIQASLLGNNTRYERVRVYQYGNAIYGRSSQTYEGCKDRGMYCAFWKTTGSCELPLGPRLCSKTCRYCGPLILVCPPHYRFGCCWDGMPARDVWKSNCKPCKDKIIACHQNRGMYEDCDLHKSNSLLIRNLCPQTCGACSDFL